ncbi:hypothetical protein WDW86_07080 [Bdellovibrionota bacterium FG-2]
MKPKVRQNHPLQWILEELETNPEFFQKKMFGALAGYLYGRLVVLVGADAEPWNGLMVPTEREFHASLLEEFPALKNHPILGKWLYISQNHPDFEEIAQRVIKLIKKRDPRIGVEPKPKKPKTPIKRKTK